MTCAIGMDSDTFYDDLLRLWPSLLIPFAIYNMFSLVKKIPKLIKAHVSTFLFIFGVFCLFLLLYILLRIATIVAFLYTTPADTPTLYNYLRAASSFFKQIQFGVLVILIAMPDERIIMLMEKLHVKKVRSESN